MTHDIPVELSNTNMGGGKSSVNLELLQSAPEVKEIIEKINKVNRSASEGKQHFKKYSK